MKLCNSYGYIRLLGNNRMIILQGISGSGKSTLAAQIAHDYAPKYKIVSRDEIRQRFMTSDELNSYFSHGLDANFEDFITNIEHEEIASILAEGKSVIIDSTNLRKKYVTEYVRIAIDLEIPTDEIVLMTVGQELSVEDAIERVNLRAIKTNKIVDEQTVRRQAISLQGANWDIEDCVADLKDYRPKQWFLPKFPVEKYVPNPDAPKAIICDIDGTLAHRALIKSPSPHLRSFFDYPACITDLVDPIVAQMVIGLEDQGYHIIFLSGRKNDCRKETEAFIQRAFGENPYVLFMRDPQIDRHNGKDDPDDIVKYRIFNEEIRNRYNVEAAIDDRKRVLALWEALGIKTVNVGKLNEVF